jgi:hypothetical protein
MRIKTAHFVFTQSRRIKRHKAPLNRKLYYESEQVEEFLESAM